MNKEVTLLAWKSVEGASVENSGLVRFEADDDGTARMQVRLSYTPPAGAAGHAVAALFGSDPKRQMGEDLMRVKSPIETGGASHDAAENGPRTLGASAR